MAQIWQDFRYAFRLLRKSPGFAAVAALTLALGIGANTAIFSLIDTVVVKQLPLDDPRSLVLLTDPAWSGIAVDTTESGVRTILSYPEFERLRAHNTVFSGMAAMQSAASLLEARTGSGQTEGKVKARCQLVSGEFFSVLGVRPALGRLLTPEDDTAGAPPAAVVSTGFGNAPMRAIRT